MDRFERDIASEPKTMLATLDHLQQDYGGIRGYLQACGVTEQQLARLQSLLVEP